MKTLEINPGINGLDTWIAVYRGNVRLELSVSARKAIVAAHATVAMLVAEGGAAYGINTGFGRLAGTVIADDALGKLQKNVVLTHTIGSGTPLSAAETRLVIAMKIASFAQGHSGVRPELVNFMVEMFNRDLLPVIPSQGSVGASGDLTPLAHVAAAMIGEGLISTAGQIMPAAEALASAEMTLLELQPERRISLVEWYAGFNIIGVNRGN